MRRVLATSLRALGLLIILWALLALVGVVAGVVPPSRPDEVATAPDGGAEAAAPIEPSARDGESEDAGAAPNADGGEARANPKRSPRAADQTPRARFQVCRAKHRALVMRAVDALGDPRPELAVACGAQVHLLAMQDTGPRLARVATLETRAARNEGSRIRPAPPVAGDVDGDSIPDLVVGFREVSAKGTVRGGHVALIRGDGTGAFAEPRRLASVPAVDLAVGPIDGTAGLEIVALGRSTPGSQRAGEVWILQGSRGPQRSTVLQTGVGGRGVIVADLDGDGNSDVLTVTEGEARIDAFFGDGTGRFPRSTSTTLAAAHEVVGGDFDGDGRADALVRTDSLHLVSVGTADTLRAHALRVGAELRRLRRADLDEDGKDDVVGVASNRIRWLRRVRARTFEAKTLLSVPGSRLTPRAVELADYDADGRLDLAMLGRVSQQGPWAIVLVDTIRERLRSGGRTVSLASSTTPLPDAPLTLRIALQAGDSGG